jgi:hypothetical protein
MRLLWSVDIEQLAVMAWHADTPGTLHLVWETDEDSDDEEGDSHSDSESSTTLSFPSVHDVEAFATVINRIWSATYQLDLTWRMD